MIDLKVGGLTVIAPEILEQMASRCQLETLTVRCLRKQLDLPAAYFVVVNQRRITDLDFEITPRDRVAVLPAIAGG